MAYGYIFNMAYSSIRIFTLISHIGSELYEEQTATVYARPIRRRCPVPSAADHRCAVLPAVRADPKIRGRKQLIQRRLHADDRMGHFPCLEPQH